jgi:hypothetical protein
MGEIMEEQLYVYEIQTRAYGKQKYQVRRKAKKAYCLDCGCDWLVRIDRKPSNFCKECLVKGERNPMFGKEHWNKGNKNFDRKSFNREYVNKLRIERKKLLVKFLGNKCQFCKQENLPICVYDFHHIDPKSKKKNVSQMLTLKLKDMYDEAKKCILLCSNCHMIHHHGDERLE